jgi:hypothetical protein
MLAAMLRNKKLQPDGNAPVRVANEDFGSYGHVRIALADTPTY